VGVHVDAAPLRDRYRRGAAALREKLSGRHRRRRPADRQGPQEITARGALARMVPVAPSHIDLLEGT
jgi:hypothetical protein